MPDTTAIMQALPLLGPAACLAWIALRGRD